MAYLRNRTLFFTTSPRTPIKMIPEIQILCENFANQNWNKETQSNFVDLLVKNECYEGNGIPKDKAFSARDRINRAPKALGFVDLKPEVGLTSAGNEFIYGNRSNEIFLRQLLKFQLPSPYHQETDQTRDEFCVKPYLEILRLIYKLKFLTFDELKIFALQLIHYKKFEHIQEKICLFRKENKRQKNYKKYVDQVWTSEVKNIYNSEIACGNLKTRESMERSEKKYITTKKRNMRDYADACFRYLRYTELVTISHFNRSISITEGRLKDVEYILSTIDRVPVYVNDLDSFKNYLFDKTIPSLYVDNKYNLIDSIMRIGSRNKSELTLLNIDELKNLKDDIIKKNKKKNLDAQISDIKSFALYSEIIDTYNEIISDDLYDAPLMLEWNTWRAMTMLNDGNIKGNFKLDDFGSPLSTAPGNMADIECFYEKFVVSVEVTLQRGQRQYECEGEPVARHYGKLKKEFNKNAYCLFVAPQLNPATVAHFFVLNKTNINYYGGKTQIVPLELDQFMKLIENAYVMKDRPKSSDINQLLSNIVESGKKAKDESEWLTYINNQTDGWPLVSDKAFS